MAFREGFVDGGWIREGDEGEAPGFSGRAINCDGGGGNVAEAGEVVCEGGLGGFPWNSADEDLPELEINHCKGVFGDIKLNWVLLYG